MSVLCSSPFVEETRRVQHLENGFAFRPVFLLLRTCPQFAVQQFDSHFASRPFLSGGQKQQQETNPLRISSGSHNSRTELQTMMAPPLPSQQQIEEILRRYGQQQGLTSPPVAQPQAQSQLQAHQQAVGAGSFMLPPSIVSALAPPSLPPPLSSLVGAHHQQQRQLEAALLAERIRQQANANSEIEALLLRQALAQKQQRILEEYLAGNGGGIQHAAAATRFGSPAAGLATTASAQGALPALAGQQTLLDSYLRSALGMSNPRAAVTAGGSLLGHPLSTLNTVPRGNDATAFPPAPPSSSPAPTATSTATSDVPFDRTFPSERQSAELSKADPQKLIRTLNVLGSTLRSKADTYFDVSDTPPDVARLGLAAITAAKGKDNKDTASHGSSGGGKSINLVNVAASDQNVFPNALYRMLKATERDGLSDIVSFMPHGRAFRVHKKDKFLMKVLPKYFVGQTKWSSFSRQLYMYGFLRVTDSASADFGGYYHELFLNGRPDLCRYMRRVGAPRNLDRRTFKLAEGEDPDFYKMKSLPKMSCTVTASSGSDETTNEKKAPPPLPATTTSTSSSAPKRPEG